MKLSELRDKLPVNEYCAFITDSSGREFYEVLGRKLQLSTEVEQLKPLLRKLHDSYGDRAQQAKTNEGIDWKAISHALRAGYQLYYIYKEGSFTYPLPETQFLLDVKQGKLDFMTVVQPALENLVAEVEELADKSDYPEKVDVKRVEDFVIEIHEKILLGAY